MNASSSQSCATPASTTSIAGELSTEPDIAPSGKDRRANRIPINLSAGLRQRGASGISVQVTDLSTDGFQVATHSTLVPGTDVWLRLPGLEPCQSRVIWSDRHVAGCVFLRPLHPAVFQMIIGKAGMRRDEKQKR